MSEEEVDEVAVCTECGSDQPLARVIKNPFFQSGQPIDCCYCGGVVIITKKTLRDQSLNQSNRERGLPPRK